MSTYTPSLGLELITPGSQAGLWGNTTNNTFNLIDQAITGVTPINFATASGTTYTLTDFNGAADESRAAVLNITGAATGSNTVVIPNKQKTYLVRNSTGRDVIFETAAPNASYTVGAGYSILIFCDGNNNVFTGIASPGVGTLSVNAGGTGTTTFTAGFIKSTGGTNALTSSATVNMATEATGTLPVTNGGTGVTSLTSGGVLIGNGTSGVSTVTASTNGYVLTWNSSTNSWAAAASAASGVTSISGISPVVVTGTTTPTISLSTVPVASGGTGLTSYTSGGAVYAAGSTTLTSGTLPITAGGTGKTSWSNGAAYVSGGALTSGTLPISAGGTGATVCPAFGADRTSGISVPVLTLTVMTSLTVNYDPGSNFNGSTGVFTAPVAGLYLFTGGFTPNAPYNGRMITMILKNGTTLSNEYGRSTDWSSSSATPGVVCQGAYFSVLSLLAAGDVMRSAVFVENGGTASGAGSFSGVLVRAT